MDFTFSVFKLRNGRGYSLPFFNFGYTEKETGTEWRFICGGTRAYMVRHATPLERDMDEQAADSHFMMRRITAALLMSGFGLYHAEPVGRVLFTDVWGDAVNWAPYIDQPDPDVGKMPEAETEELYGWIGALCTHTVLRRAAEDAHAALVNPHEALVYVYRGLEWFTEGMGYSWDEIAAILGGTKNDIRDLKKSANVETGVRHASKSGIKTRAQVQNYGIWVSNLFDVINAARTKVEPTYQTVAGKRGGYILSRAIPPVPFE